MEILLILLVLSFPVCAFVALGLAIGARKRLKEVDEHWRRRVNELTRRVQELEGVRPPAPPPAPKPPPFEPPPRLEPEPASMEPPRRLEPEPPPREPVVRVAPAMPKPAPEPRASLEERIGGRWFNWVGILAILFGVAYAMKYSFERGWVTPTMRFWGGLLFGMGLLAAGTLSDRKSYAVLARGFWGGGIGVLFVVFFAGFKLLLVDGEPILGRGLAFAGMAATVAIGVAIAILHDTRTTAALSAIGGYLTPVLLRTGVPDQVFLFTYLLILTGGLLFLGYWKRWGFLRLLTFGVVVAYFAGWWITEGTGAPWAMLLYPSALFLFFATEIAAWSALRKVADASASYVLLGLVTTLHTLSGLAVLDHHFTAFRGAFLVATAAYLLLGARVISRRHPEDRPLALCYGYSAGVLLLLAPAFEARLHGSWHSCVWALEGALLFRASEVWGVRGHGRVFAYAAFGLAAVRLLAYDTPVSLFEVRSYLPLWNARGLAYAIVTGSFVFGCWRSWRREREGPVEDAEHLAATGLWILTLSLPAVLFSLELDQALDTYVKPRFAGRGGAYAHQASHWMTLLWAAYATLVATVTSRRGVLVLRNVALVFGAFVLCYHVVRGLADTYVTQQTPLLNSRFGVTAALALCLFWCAREFRFLPARGAAHLFLLAGLGMEWIDLCHVRGLGHVDALTGASHDGWCGAPWFGFTILIALYGRALLARGHPALRLLSLALVAAAAAKFLLLDLAFVATRTVPMFDIRFVAGAVAAAACLTAASRGWPTFLRLLGHLVVVVSLSADALDLSWRYRWANGDLAMTGLWAAYGFAALRTGHGLSRRHLRAFGLVLLWLSLVGGLLVLPAGDRASRLFFNVRCLGLGVTAAGLLLAAGIYRRGAPPAPLLRLSEFVEGTSLGVPLSLAGHGLVMLLLTLEAADHFHLAGSEEHARQLSYSLIWAVYAIGMVVSGLLRRYRPVRLMALAVLAATILKVFLFDLSFLEGVYRILSFLALGAILVAVSFLYQKFRRVLA
jgi:uncharacterized membrane protein